MCHRAHLCRADDARIVVIAAHDHQGGLGRTLVQLSRRLGHVELREVGVDQHDIWRGQIDDRDRLPGSRDLGEDLDVKLALEDLANADPMDRARLDEDDPDGIVGRRSGRPAALDQGWHLGRLGVRAS